MSCNKKKAVRKAPSTAVLHLDWYDKMNLACNDLTGHLAHYDKTGYLDCWYRWTSCMWNDNMACYDTPGHLAHFDTTGRLACWYRWMVTLLVSIQLGTSLFVSIQLSTLLFVSIQRSTLLCVFFYTNGHLACYFIQLRILLVPKQLGIFIVSILNELIIASYNTNLHLACCYKWTHCLFQFNSVPFLVW